MIRAFSQNENVNLDQQMPAQMGDNALHFLLRTASKRFSHSKKDTIAALLQAKINPTKYDQWGNNALHILAASSTGSDAGEILRLFLCEASNMPRTVREASLCHINVRNGYGGNGNTPLTLAVLENNIESTRLLLENGADPHSTGEFEQTALDLAVMRQRSVLHNLVSKSLVSKIVSTTVSPLQVVPV